MAKADSFADQTWLETDAGGKEIECPNAIEFHQSKYEVFNDCYGVNRNKPIVESGIFKRNNNSLTLEHRKTTQKELGLLPGNADITADIVKLTHEQLTLKIGDVYLYFLLNKTANPALKGTAQKRAAP